ncbi:Uncharacterised protein [[Eubacterium] contortum]|uniref:Phage minor structural protein, N-terminal region n=1 Tax=Faecalicatena contorta TaxID=39482 RepID=A0A174LRX1_9FIRM|nr:hypothetical protein [Faecalicatena contorta]CUP25347.1 Uncharacterised protein [[Eubacterium] contortum] [Faecalicatena contorta]
MYQPSAAFAELIQKDSRTFKSKLIIGQNEIETDIKSIILRGGSNSGSSFIIGSCISQYIEVEMAKQTILIENKELEWRIGANISDTVEEYIPMGFFTANKPEADEDMVKFTAFDRMMKTERAYFSSLPASTTTVAVLKEMSTFLSIPIVTTGLSAITIKRPDGYTCREVLSYISQMYAGFAICNRQGQIEIKKYAVSNISIAPTRYWDTFKHNDFPYTFQKIVCYTGKDENGESISITAGSGNRELTISNPLMTQSILNSVAAALKGFSYMPGSLRFLGDPRIDPWDIIKVSDRDGHIYSVPAMSMTQDFDGGMTTSVEAPGESETEEQQGFKGPVTQAIERYAVQLALVDHAIVNKLDVNVANITYAKITDLEATNAIITKLKTEDLVAINAKINTANINLGNIENLLSGNAGVGDLTNIHLTSQNAVIESALIKSAVMQSVTVNDLLAGTIYTNKFQIWSDEAGGMKIFGSTQQWMDKDGRIRMQAGLGSDGAFNYYIVDAAGNTMFDALNGVSAAGIKAPIIKDSMVADDANINGNKVDVQTLTQNINGSNVQILGSKVVIDGTSQTISAKFDSMQEEIDSISASGGGYILQTYVEGGHTGDGETATIHARLYASNKEVTETFGPEHYVWSRLSEDDSGDDAWNGKRITGYSIQLSGTDVTMMANFECKFLIWDEFEIITKEGASLQTKAGEQLIAKCI